MYTRYYDTYPSSQRQNQPMQEHVLEENAVQIQSNTPQKIIDTAPATQKEAESVVVESIREPADKIPAQTASFLPFGGLGGFKGDDLLLVAVLLLVLTESKDDSIMPLILGYLLLGGGL